MIYSTQLYLLIIFLYNWPNLQSLKSIKTKDLSSYWDSLGRFSSACLCHFKHTIVYMFWSMWTPQRISHLRLCLWCNIALRNPFSENKSRIFYIYHTISTAILLNKCCCNMTALFSFDLFIFHIQLTVVISNSMGPIFLFFWQYVWIHSL